MSPFFLYFGTFMCPILFQSFCIALLSLSRNMLDRSYFRAWSIYFSGDGKHVLAYSQCRNSWLFLACMWVLILGAWNISQRGHKTWPNSTQSKRHICGRFCHVWSYMALVGIWMSFKEHVIWILFCKINSKYFARMSKCHIILLYLIRQLLR